MTLKRIHIEPAWVFRDDAGNGVDPQLFRLLQALHEHGKLTQAAKQVGLSYRHAWNLLNKWGSFFGTEVVLLEKGRGARLTLLGEKLLWAEQRVAERFKPQMESLASEINLELHRALEGAHPLLKMQASHGYAVALLPDYVSGVQMDIQYGTPLESLQALNRGACDIAGFHIPRGLAVPHLREGYAKEIRRQSQVAIRYVSRKQGLMVQKDNPKGINTLGDLSSGAVRFINRQKDSGTRLLFDQLLKNAEVNIATIDGYANQEFTHGAIAAFVASGMADVGFGVEAAARQFDLEFIPLAEEDYILVCQRQSLKDAAMESFIASLQSQDLNSAIANLPGYGCDGAGELLQWSDLEELF